MSGHSKWHGIKHKKAKADAARGRIFTRLIREITIAAKMGGGDPDGNPRLRTAIQAARAANMPADNIERAVKKGTGELPGVTYEELTYEGYGPGGVAVMVTVTTDNKNRTAAEIRKVFAKHGANLGESGCVGWMFEKKGVIQVDAKGVDEERLLGVALEAGAEDVRQEEGLFEILTPPREKEFEAVRAALAKAKFPIASAELTMVPQSTVKLDGRPAEQMLRLMEELEDHDDVQNVYANFDIPESIMVAVSG
ncbi:MAG: YebC/PmpR family DNA-binding transcriptional regulator [candidate division NC10 bacterium]|nr:YebC/PmpR family DNA-binding transcriptional regulator [candidate division NC10 bacterium]